MVTAPLITPSMIDLPSEGKASRQPDQIIQIVLGKNDSLEMKIKDKTTPLSMKELASAVKSAQMPRDNAAASSSAVVISADKSAKYESVVKVMDTLQRAGIQRVGLSVQLAN